MALVESNHKKAIFLQQARIELSLKNVEVVADRVENFSSAEGFDTVISRAFSDLADFVRLAGHLCRQGDGEGRLVAMKGIYPHEELAQLSRNWTRCSLWKKYCRLRSPALRQSGIWL